MQKKLDLKYLLISPLLKGGYKTQTGGYIPAKYELVGELRGMPTLGTREPTRRGIIQLLILDSLS